MNNGEQFKIDSIDELEQVYEMFKNDWVVSSIDYEKAMFLNKKEFITKKYDNVFLSVRYGRCRLISSPLKNKSMFNQELIQKLREGKIAVKNDGSLEQLQAVLKEAFPKGDEIGGDSKFYYFRGFGTSNWWCSDMSVKNKEEVSIKDFFKDLKGFPKKYVLREPNHLFEDELSPDHPNVEHLTKAGVFEALYKPIYEETKPDLPEINGYKGELVSEIGGKVVKYGCAYLYLEWFKETANRHIECLTLSSGVSLSVQEMEKIRKYLEYYDHI